MSKRPVGPKEQALREQRETASTARPDTSPLDRRERLTLGDMESVIEKGLQTFVEVGAALSQIRKERLYRETHGSFEAYCQDRWGWSRQRSSQLIAASETVAGLSTIVDKTTHKLPINEAQARELTKAPKEDRPAIMEEASGNGRPTAKAIREAVERREPEPEPERFEPDPGDELVRALEENAKFADRLDLLEADDTGAELSVLHEKYVRLESRLNQALTTGNEAQTTAKYCQGELRKIRTELGVERNQDIIPAIRALRS